MRPVKSFCGFYRAFLYFIYFLLSLIVYFRKRLTPEILGEINEMIVRDAIKRKEEADAETVL